MIWLPSVNSIIMNRESSSSQNHLYQGSISCPLHGSYPDVDNDHHEEAEKAICHIYQLYLPPGTPHRPDWHLAREICTYLTFQACYFFLGILSFGYLKIHADWEFCPWLYHFFIPSIKARCRLNCLYCQRIVLNKIANFWRGYFPIPDDIAKIFSKLPFWLWQVLCGWPVVGWHQFRLGSFPSPSPGTPLLAAFFDNAGEN